MLTLKNQTIDPPLMLAPMMDITGQAFRNVVRHFGGCAMFYSEMLNARRVVHEGLNKPIYRGFSDEQDVMIQLLGNDPDSIGQAMERLEVFQPMGFDLNMGCSRGFIVDQGWGAALLQDLKTTQAIVRKMRRTTNRIVTVKCRNGWANDKDAKNYITMLEGEGIDGLIFHPRTTEKIFTRPAKWEWIAKIKSWTKVPVIGNGDVKNADDGLRMFKETQCDGIMIGRGAVGRPQLFSEIQNVLQNNNPGPTIKASTIFKLMLEQVENRLDEAKTIKELRLFCQYFSESLPVPHWFWGPLQCERDPQQIINHALAFLERNKL